MDDHGQIRNRDLFLETCLLAGIRHVGHGQRHWGAVRRAAPWGRGMGLVAASGQSCGPGAKGAVPQHPLRWAWDSNHLWPRAGDRQASMMG